MKLIHKVDMHFTNHIEQQFITVTVICVGESALTAGMRALDFYKDQFKDYSLDKLLVTSLSADVLINGDSMINLDEEIEAERADKVSNSLTDEKYFAERTSEHGQQFDQQQTDEEWINQQNDEADCRTDHAQARAEE